MTFFVIANLKSHKTFSEMELWLKAVSPLAKKANPQIKVIVSPSYPYLQLAASRMPSAICSQDVSPFPPGSYTGAVNVVQLLDLGVKYSIVGHSERRQYFHETPMEVSNKIRELHDSDLIPILCLSKEDIAPQLATLEEEDKKNLLVVYEPPADIGGTEIAPIKDISKVVAIFKTEFPNVPILYGGSVNARNIQSIIGLVDGVLVGTACLDPVDFISLIQEVVK